MTHPATVTAALYRAIVENPDDDTARLVYADALEESGDEARAEFVRVQVEDAYACHDVDEVGSCPNGCRRCYLQERQAALLAAHGRDWLWGPRCEYAECRGGKIYTKNGKDWVRCLSCHGHGYTGSLAATPLEDVEFRRGFPDVVRVERTGELMECANCHGVGQVHVYTGHGNYAVVECWVCADGVSRDPEATTWARQLFDAHPLIERLLPMDQEPTQEEGGWEWYNLPDFLNVPKTKQTFNTPDEARQALARAIAGWLRADWLSRHELKL